MRSSILFAAVVLSRLQAVVASKRQDHATSVIEFVRAKARDQGVNTTSASSRILKAAMAQREAIRRHMKIDEKQDSDKWLDAIVGFPNKDSREILKDRMKDAVQGGQLIVGMMGISTTAGHDIYHSQSYSHVFGRQMRTVLAVGGVNVTVRNHAIGGFGVMPNSLCVETMVGNDVHILGWDYMMMAPREDCRVEFFARAGMMLPSKPALVFWQGGVWLPPDGK